MAMHLSCSWLRHVLTTCSVKKYPYFQFIIFFISVVKEAPLNLTAPAIVEARPTVFKI